MPDQLLPLVSEAASAPGLALLREAGAWVFDLDNTLYPASFNLFAQIDTRMRAYIAEFLDLGLEEAYQLQKHYFREYGTSLRGLMHVHGLDPTPFLEQVHDIDVSVLPPDPALEAVLARLPGRKVIFTNAPTRHAERVTERLGIDHHFDFVFDIVEAGYQPKPEPETYAIMVERCGLDPEVTIMVEDMARNLAPASALGMTTVWVRSGSELGAFGAEETYIDHIVEDLVAWLEAVAEGQV